MSTADHGCRNAYVLIYSSQLQLNTTIAKYKINFVGIHVIELDMSTVLAKSDSDNMAWKTNQTHLILV